MKKVISVILTMMMLIGTYTYVSASTVTVDAYETLLSENYNLQTPTSYFSLHNFRDGKGAHDVLGNDSDTTASGKGVVRKIWFNNKNIGLTQEKVYAAWNGFSSKMTGNVNKISFDYKLEGPTGVMIGFGTANPWFCYSKSPWFIFIRQGSIYVAPESGTNTAYDLINSNMDAHKTYTVDNTQWNRMTIEIDKTAKTGKVYIGDTLIKTMDTTGTAVTLDTFDAFAFECPMQITSIADTPVLNIDNLKIEADSGNGYVTTLDESYDIKPGTTAADYDTYMLTSDMPYYGHGDGSGMTESYIVNEDNDYARKLTFNTKAETKEVYAGLGGLKALKTANNASKMSIKLDMKVEGSTPIAMFATKGAAYLSQGHLTGIFGSDKAFGLWVAPYKGSSDYTGYSALTYEQASSAGFASKLPYVKPFVTNTAYEIEWILDFANAKTELYMDGQKLAEQTDLSNPNDIENLMFNVAGAITNANASAVVIDNLVVSKLTNKESGVGLVNGSGEAITSVASGTAYVKATAANDGKEKSDFFVLAAAYDTNDVLIACTKYDISDVAAGGYKEISGTEGNAFTIPSGATKLKTFLWKSTYAPICEGAAVPAQ